MRVQLLTEQSLRLEKLAKEGLFPLLSDENYSSVPQTVAVSKPNVNLRAKTTRALAKNQNLAHQLLIYSPLHAA